MGAGERMTVWARGLAAAALLFAAGLVDAAELTLRKEGDKADTSIKLRTEVPSYRAPPGSYLYGGSYPAPHPYYYPYPYPPPYMYAPPPGENRAPPAPRNSTAGQEHIPVGQIIILTDPVSAEVFLDGLRLTQRDDLSYVVGLLEGRHKVKVQAMGYVAYDKTIDVLGGRGKFLTIRLTPSAETPATR